MFIPRLAVGHQVFFIQLDEFSDDNISMKIKIIDPQTNNISGTYSIGNVTDLPFSGKFFLGPQFVDSSNLAQITFSVDVPALGTKLTKVYTGFVKGPGIRSITTGERSFFIAGGFELKGEFSTDEFCPLPFSGTAELQGI
jgi:hypothetical protein